MMNDTQEPLNKDMELLLEALGDASRLILLDALRRCERMSDVQLTRHLKKYAPSDVREPILSHFRVLERAGLIVQVEHASARQSIWYAVADEETRDLLESIFDTLQYYLEQRQKQAVKEAGDAHTAG